MSRAPSASAPPRKASREVELSLVIVGRDPEAVRRRLARVRKLGRYALRPRGSARIVDSYFDTADRRLRARGIALRVREVGSETLVSVKGRPRSASTRTEDRFEREEPFSAAAVEAIARQLHLGRPRSAVDENVGPVELLESWLRVRLIQERHTVRLLRDVLDSREPKGPVLAELAIDRVQFRVERRRVRHYEVEIEAKRTGRGTEAARAVAAELLARYPDELEGWSYGKLPTGLAIEELLVKGRLERLGPNGAVTPEGYEQLRRYLDRRDRRAVR